MVALIKAKLRLAYLFVPVLNLMIRLSHRLGRPQIEDFAYKIMLKLQIWGERNGL